MLDAKRIVEIINKVGIQTYKFDYSIYNKYILDMYNWYRGYDAGFHIYKHYNGKKTNDIEKARLNMAKRVCEDLASLTVNENITVNIEDKEVNNLLLGYDEMTGVLGQNNFWGELSKLYEITCALGTGAMEIVVEDLLKVNDKIISSKNSKLKIVSHTAMDIIPLSWDSNGNITEVAFIDQYKDKEDTLVDLRMHILDENKNYKIVNKKLKVYGINDEIKFINEDDDTVMKEFNTGSNIPWFSVLKLPIINNYDITSPMGASVYGNALDILKNIDDAFTILTTEYRYGVKKIFYHNNLLQRNEKGEVISPDTADKNVFYFMGDDFDSNTTGKELIKEFNPELRIDDICGGIENGLNYLSVICGLGNGYYKFSAGSVQKTATEVISENSSMYRNICKNQLTVSKFLIIMFKALIYANNFVFGTRLNVNAKIGIEFDASIIEDKNSIRERDLREVDLGIMTIEEYRAKYYESGRRDSRHINE